MMQNSIKKKAVLLLADGSVYEGFSIGREGSTKGEICFNTGMTGYQEIYTDPSYFGQIIVNTNTHIGNYGVLSSETESLDVKIRGLVVKSFSDVYSREKAGESLHDYLRQANIVGITAIDTRKLVKHIRKNGAMNGIITTDVQNLKSHKNDVEVLPTMKGAELASKVCTKKNYYVGNKKAKFKIAVLDVGIKKSILKNLTERDCYCKVFPANTSFERMLDWKPNGFFISNGPGDPEAMNYAVKVVKKIIEKNHPLFGICLGHQLIARASGLTTYKMHHGHRGLNHPVKNLLTGKCEITSQNHGFSVDESSLSNNENIEVTHRNLNDNTIEGIRLKDKQVFSVQYHPEAAPGPHDSLYLFDDFIEMLDC